MSVIYNGKFYSTVVDQSLKDVRKEVARLANAKKGDKILDVCCGTGHQAGYFAREGAEVIGIDITESMINEAAKKVKKYSSLNFKIADATRLPFSDESFDVTTTCLALHEKEELQRKAILSEMARVTKKGGHMIITDFKVPAPGNFHSWLIKILERLAGKEHYENYRNYVSNGGLGNLLKGFKVENSAELKGGNIISVKIRR